MNLNQLKQIFPKTPEATLKSVIMPLKITMAKYEINTDLRKVAFIAQVGHESGGFLYKEELASGAAYDTGEKARSLGNTPQKDGDGQFYKGRGYIQITGANNYKRLANDLNMTIEQTVQFLKTDFGAVFSAGWYWNWKKLNAYADRQNMAMLTKKINGGFNGFVNRCRIYDLAMKVMGIK